MASQETIVDRIMQVGGLDEGTDYQFRVYAVNQIGKSRPKIFDGLACTKKVSGSAPEVISSLTNTSVLAEDKCRFDCRINSQPAADIEWFKSNERLVPSKKYKFDTDGTTQILIINDTQQADEGTYYCAARNQFGRQEVSATLSVQSEPKFDTTSKFCENVEFRQGSTVNITIPYIMYDTLEYQSHRSCGN